MTPAPPQRLRVDGRDVRVTHLDKVLYPATGTTKADVLSYVVHAADALLPQLRGRPVTRVRWPEGVADERFFEKNVPRGAPDWVRHLRLPAAPGAGGGRGGGGGGGGGRGGGRGRRDDDEGTVLDLPFLDDAAGLVWAANGGALELHTPQWRVGPRGGVRPPDRLVVDLDPGAPAGLAECAEVAHLVAERLRADGLEPVPVTSGSKGLQLYAPLPSHRADLRGDLRGAMDVHAYAKDLAQAVAADHPDLVTWVMRKDVRGGKVLLDWSQNHPAKTTITPYSLRGRERPHVAAPRTWDEIGPGLTQLTPDEVLARLDAGTDPFAGTDVARGAGMRAPDG
ncbi:ATP-dependent DNA ligase [Cellulomonas marina]|uniref:Bifunctional non-homologous end joining protein LigD n=1 Tax=Cellulomonas marina TaxID=988821 RepID=A0A1I0ZYW1_9CELL|nr:ATP-dependent DNA ligase [Cellulomonas marina]GIG30546.1 ATP-dependent DNA ligase [Cellulomonas marina]SFB29630.1 bifunctional non-homologous end joining protein LigD [Cellulomonas marina]